MKNLSTGLVIGGSIGGLLAARVLSDFYSKVLIVEKDAFPDGPEHRRGTPQAFHPHRITLRGKAIIDRFFPDYEQDLISFGAPSSLNKIIHQQNQYGTMVSPYPRNDIKFSRAVLEYVLRERVRKIENIHFLQQHDVLSLTASPENSRITGVLARDRETDLPPYIITADLVIDTSGRTSKLTEWLGKLGYTVPLPDKMTADIGYSTRRYKLPPGKEHLADKWDAVNVGGTPGKTFLGAFSFIENQVAETILYRPDGVCPPSDPVQFEKEIGKLPSPLISELISGLDPISPPKSFRVPHLFRQHFEQMENWPAGLLVLGDAYSNFDPIFGQGMTVAAMEAELLYKELEHNHTSETGYEQNLLKKFQHVIEAAWWLNCAADLRWHGVGYEGTQPLKGIDFGQTFMDLYLKYATEKQDWKLYGLYWAVNTLSVSPRTIFNPQMVRTVLSSSSHGQSVLAELENGKPLEEALRDILPDFSEEIFAAAKTNELEVPREN
ncbi:FAD-dependent oxidoreductase [Fictibacillus fluitans]|uniref:FAD dependent oxidoreductase n=1 Tax=Fictibacillus fluitans TaxID=3058422 RepID=A0ABT8HW26_9BACL|nr:FAD dependent oxidoreductase [Fictibacillus sp. NE201]MDN4524980.1 FAD dependent oxidoreductase [Fictibacillus sp. NE201]